MTETISLYLNKATKIPFWLSFCSLFSKSATLELERLVGKDKLMSYMLELETLDEDVAWKIDEEEQSSKERIQNEALNSKLRIAQIKANGDIRKRTLRYEIDCLKLKGVE